MKTRAMITLAPLQPECVTSFYHWIRDPEVIEYSLSAFQTMQTTPQIDAWFDTVLQDEKSPAFGIYTADTHTFIGYAGLTGLSATNQSGEYFIFIGDKSQWGKGVGTVVTKQVLALGFTTYHLNRIMLTVSETNLGGLKAYAKAGFLEEGRLRQACRRHGRFHDKIVMSVLRAEWQHAADQVPAALMPLARV